jgi:hypothetical protein
MRRWVTIQLGLACAALAVAAAIWGFGRLKVYVDEDPRLCAQCHRTSPEFALWTRGSHRGVACQRCHHAAPGQLLAMLRAYLAGRAPGAQGRHAEVSLGACAACHLSHDTRWPQVERSPGHRVHVEVAGIACVRCHAQAMHGFAPASDACRRCHAGHAARHPGGAPATRCASCHAFRGPGGPAAPEGRP